MRGWRLLMGMISVPPILFETAKRRPPQGTVYPVYSLPDHVRLAALKPSAIESLVPRAGIMSAASSEPLDRASTAGWPPQSSTFLSRWTNRFFFLVQKAHSWAKETTTSIQISSSEPRPALECTRNEAGSKRGAFVGLCANSPLLNFGLRARKAGGENRDKFPERLIGTKGQPIPPVGPPGVGAEIQRQCS